MMKTLVTGAAGFVGSHVVQRLVARGDQVIGLDNFNSYYDPQLKEARAKRLEGSSLFQMIRADLSDRAAIENLFTSHRFECVIHLGAQAGVRYSLTNPHAYADANLTGFLNILEGCRQSKVSHLVYASSSSVYGLNAEMPFRVSENVDHPISLYAATKKANELMAHSYSHLYRIPTTGLRFFTVYGPWGRPDMAYFSFTKAIIEGKTIDVFNHGKMRRDFTYIDDIVEGVIRTSDIPAEPDPLWRPEHPNPGSSSAPYRLYNIGNHSPVELGTFIETLEELIGKKAEKRYLDMQPGDVLATGADVSDLEKAVGFSPKTDIRTGLAKFVAWYKGYYS